MTKSLNNMVLCMISEYHLMCLSQGPSYISLVLPEAVKNLLPSLEEYRAGGDFQGTRDARVLEKAKTLRVAVWLHHLDMATTGDRMASYSLDTTRHGWGPLLEFLLTPWASNLMFEEVVDWVLVENQYKTESFLDHIQELQAWLQGELEDLHQARKDEPDTSAQRRMKKEMERKWKDLKGLEATISEYEYDLGRAWAWPENAPVSDNSQSNPGAKGAMAITPVANNAPPASTAPESLTSPPGEEQTHAMGIDDGDERQTPASPVSHRQDELLTGDTVVGVEGEMANLMVSSPGEGKGGDKGASV